MHGSYNAEFSKEVSSVALSIILFKFDRTQLKVVRIFATISQHQRCYPVCNLYLCVYGDTSLYVSVCAVTFAVSYQN
jgi:hypothetical protein